MARPAEQVRSVHDLLQSFRSLTACWIWAKNMNALANAHDTAVQMIDTSIVRVHQHGSCITRNRTQSMGRSRGGLTSKIHALVDTDGLPVRLAVTPGEVHDNRLAGKLLSRLRAASMLLADRGYDADWIRAAKGAWANIPPKSNHDRIYRRTCGTAACRTSHFVDGYAAAAPARCNRWIS
jgi:transposase